MRSQGLEREGMLVEPGEVGLTSMEPAGDGIDQDTKRRLAKLPAGLAEGYTPLDPLMAFDARRPIGPFAPQHGKAQGSRGAILRGFDPVCHQEHPQRRPLARQPPDQAPGLIGARMVPLKQGAQPRIPRAPLTAGGRRLGHGAPVRHLRACPAPTGCQGRVGFFRHASRRTDEGGHTRVAPVPPGLIDAVASAHQEALPRLAEGAKGCFGAVGMQESARHGGRSQRPQPVPSVLAVPGSVVDRADGRWARQGGHGLIVGPEGL